MKYKPSGPSPDPAVHPSQARLRQRLRSPLPAANGNDPQTNHLQSFQSFFQKPENFPALSRRQNSQETAAGIRPSQVPQEALQPEDISCNQHPFRMASSLDSFLSQAANHSEPTVSTTTGVIPLLKPALPVSASSACFCFTWTRPPGSRVKPGLRSCPP